jgi:hypothetical protein
MAERFDGLHPGALAYACRNHLAVVQVPPRGLWGRSAQVRTTTTEAWLGRSIDPEPSIDAVVRRYLAAFGPATVADVAAWSGLTGLRAVVDRLRPELVTFRDERGRELVDVPDAPLPDRDTPAPVRFLPVYDNAILAHDDRSRILADGHPPNIAHLPTVLVDGFAVGTWELDDGRLEVRLFADVPARGHGALEEEGERLLAFASESEPRGVRVDVGS